MLKYLILIYSLLLLFSCGKNKNEATADAILSANIALSKNNCQVAIDTLEANGRVSSNAAYLKTLASAYACRAGYSTVTFFDSDIANTVSPAPFGGTTKYTTSSAAVQTTLQNDQKFKDLQEAINILLYAGGIASTTEPTSAERAKYFSSSEVADIDSQLLYMVLVQLGRYMYFYGDSSATGIKGSGIGDNTCLTSYVNASPAIKAILTAAAGTCSNITDTSASHSQLSSAIDAGIRKTRLCHGVVLLNSVFELLPNVIATIFSNSADKTATLAVMDSINLAKDVLVTADSTTAVVASTLSQTVCEDDGNVSVSNIESYFGGLFEGVFQ